MILQLIFYKIHSDDPEVTKNKPTRSSYNLYISYMIHNMNISAGVGIFLPQYLPMVLEDLGVVVERTVSTAHPKIHSSLK